MPLIGFILNPAKTNRADVIGGQTDETKSSNVFDDNQMSDAQEAAKNCPVSAITVTQQ